MLRNEERLVIQTSIAYQRKKSANDCVAFSTDHLSLVEWFVMLKLSLFFIFCSVDHRCVKRLGMKSVVPKRALMRLVMSPSARCCAKTGQPSRRRLKQISKRHCLSSQVLCAGSLPRHCPLEGVLCDCRAPEPDRKRNGKLPIFLMPFRAAEAFCADWPSRRFRNLSSTSRASKLRSCFFVRSQRPVHLAATLLWPGLAKFSISEVASAFWQMCRVRTRACCAGRLWRINFNDSWVSYLIEKRWRFCEQKIMVRFT